MCWILFCTGMMFRCNCYHIRGENYILAINDGLASVEILKVDVVQLAVNGNMAALTLLVQAVKLTASSNNDY